MESEKKKILIKRLYDSAFPEDVSWNDWFFKEVYDTAQGLMLMHNDEPVSSVLLQQYEFNYYNKSLRLAYFSGANTHYKARGNGYMSQLMTIALKEAYGRGDALAAVIPAQRRLFFFYDRFGFATVIYNNIERYTSLHVFNLHEDYEYTEPKYSDFQKLEHERPLTVLHSESDFNHIIQDITHENGTVVQVNKISGDVAAMGFAFANNDEIHVTEILGNDLDAKEMVLAGVKSFFNTEKPIIVWDAPSGDRERMRSRGMLRIVNVERILEALSESNPNLKYCFKINDNILPKNNGIYCIQNGTCLKLNHLPKDTPLVEVSVDVLAEILFNGRNVGDIFGLPTGRPCLPLMLD